MATASSSRDPVATASSPYFPPDLTPEIARRLTSLQDFFALRAACRAYCAVLPLTPANLASQEPLLLVPHKRPESHALFDLPLRRIRRFRLPIKRLTAGDHRFTSCHSLGCRLAFNGRCDLHIVHLLTGERARLPSPPDYPNRVLLSGDLVITWNYFGNTIQYCRLEAAEWRTASIREPYCLDELIFVDGTLYAMVTPGYRLAVVQLSENSNSVELQFLGGELDVPIMQLNARPLLYLGDCCGKLILISAMEFDRWVYHVFRWKPAEAKWVRITSLGGCSLFLENHCFVGALVLTIQGFKGTAYTSQRRQVIGASILWLMGLLMYLFLTTLEKQYCLVLGHRYGFFQACVDALT